MTRALLNRRLTRVHRWLGIVLGAQVVIWLASGLFMTLFPIKEVRGDHLRKPASALPLVWRDDLISANQALAQLSMPAHALSAGTMAGQPVWRAKTEKGSVLIDAKSGVRIDRISAVQALSVAKASYTGAGQASQPHFFAEPPQELGGDAPAWRVDFGPKDKASLYVDASSGEVRAVRTDLWRVYDVFWGLHIMDWSSRENFNSWWLKASAAFGLIFALSGMGLALLRVRRMLGRRQHDREMTRPST